MFKGKIDLKPFQKLLERHQAFQKQLPYLASRALNDTAKKAEAALKKDFENRFKVRKPYALKSIKTKLSHKSQYPHLRAELGSTMRAMPLHVIGGEKKSKRGDLLGVPTSVLGPGKPRESIMSPIPLARTFPRLKRRKRHFIRNVRGNSILLMRFKKKILGKRKDPRGNLKMIWERRPHPMYLERERLQIKAAFPMLGIIRDTVKKSLPESLESYVKRFYHDQQ